MVTLSLYQYKLGVGVSGNASLYFHKIISPFDQNSATWVKATANSQWNARGGDFESKEFLRISMIPGQTLNSWHDIDVTDIIKESLGNPNSNYGVLLLMQVRSDMIFCSSEYSDQEKRPKLTVDYEPSTINKLNTNHVKMKNDITIFKSTDKIKISCNEYNNSEISLFSVTGKKYDISPFINKSDIIIPRSVLSKGIYFLKVVKENGSENNFKMAF